MRESCGILECLNFCDKCGRKRPCLARLLILLDLREPFSCKMKAMIIRINKRMDLMYICFKNRLKSASCQNPNVLAIPPKLAEAVIIGGWSLKH